MMRTHSCLSLGETGAEKELISAVWTREVFLFLFSLAPY